MGKSSFAWRFLAFMCLFIGSVVGSGACGDNSLLSPAKDTVTPTGINTCIEENPVPCLIGAYGCGAVDNEMCTDGNRLLYCRCGNPNDKNKGTWLAEPAIATACVQYSLCWRSSLGLPSSNGANGAGGANGSAVGSGGAHSGTGNGGASGTSATGTTGNTSTGVTSTGNGVTSTGVTSTGSGITTTTTSGSTTTTTTTTGTTSSAATGSTGASTGSGTTTSATSTGASTGSGTTTSTSSSSTGGATSSASSSSATTSSSSSSATTSSAASTGASSSSATTSSSSSSSTSSSSSSTGGGVTMTMMVLNFTPAATLVPDPGPVIVEGWYTGLAAGSWQTLCTMTVTNGTWSCTPNVPTGAELFGNVKFLKSTASGGYCWAFNKSTDVPCGGNGVFLGTFAAMNGNVLVNTSLVWNGFGASPPSEVYYNFHINPTP